MKHAILATLAIIAMTALSGCLMGDPEVDGQQRWNIRDLARHPDLDGVFVSGHLGNYTDCRDQGYTEADGQDRASAPANDADVGFGACQPTDDGDGSCGSYPLNCEDAQFTIELSNKGEITARGVSIERIELLDENGRVLTSFPLIQTVDTDTLEAFDGRVEPTEKLILRVDFQGPGNLSEFYPSAAGFQSSSRLRIIITSDNEQTLRIETRSIEPMPQVAT